jgi:hypothetical protein
MLPHQEHRTPTLQTSLLTYIDLPLPYTYITQTIPAHRTPPYLPSRPHYNLPIPKALKTTTLTDHRAPPTQHRSHPQELTKHRAQNPAHRIYLPNIPQHRTLIPDHRTHPQPYPQLARTYPHRHTQFRIRLPLFNTTFHKFTITPPSLISRSHARHSPLSSPTHTSPLSPPLSQTSSILPLKSIPSRSTRQAPTIPPLDTRPLPPAQHRRGSSHTWPPLGTQHHHTATSPLHPNTSQQLPPACSSIFNRADRLPLSTRDRPPKLLPCRLHLTIADNNCLPAQHTPSFRRLHQGAPHATESNQLHSTPVSLHPSHSHSHSHFLRQGPRRFTPYCNTRTHPAPTPGPLQHQHSKTLTHHQNFTPPSAESQSSHPQLPCSSNQSDTISSPAPTTTGLPTCPTTEHCPLPRLTPQHPALHERISPCQHFDAQLQFQHSTELPLQSHHQLPPTLDTMPLDTKASTPFTGAHLPLNPHIWLEMTSHDLQPPIGMDEQYLAFRQQVQAQPPHTSTSHQRSSQHQLDADDDLDMDAQLDNVSPEHGGNFIQVPQVTSQKSARIIESTPPTLQYRHPRIDDASVSQNSKRRKADDSTATSTIPSKITPTTSSRSKRAATLGIDMFGQMWLGFHMQEELSIQLGKKVLVERRTDEEFTNMGTPVSEVREFRSLRRAFPRTKQTLFPNERPDAVPGQHLHFT